MSEPADGLLFDVSPIEEEGGKKKKKTARPKAEPATHIALIVEEPSANYLASIDGHYACERCGTTVLDLVDTRKTDLGQKWLVQCGWYCGLLMLVDPVPGLLDKEDRKQADVFRMRGGRFDGKSLAEIDAEGGRWYIELLVSGSKRSAVQEAAKKYLDHA
jgi:hypothetical protein